MHNIDLNYINASTDESLLKLKEIKDKIFLTYPLYLCPLGTIGNLLCMVIFSRKSFKMTNIGFYFCCLGVADLLHLNFGGLFHYFKTRDQELLTSSVILCKLYYVSTFVFPLWSSWCLVIVSINRIKSLNNTRPILVIRRTHQLEAVFIAALLSIVANLHNIVVPGLYEIKSEVTNISEKRCGIPPNYNFLVPIRDWFDLFAFAVVPFLILVICSIMITMKLCEIKNRKRVLTKRMGKRRDITYALTSLVLNLLFFACFLPLCIINIVKNSLNSSESKAIIGVAHVFAVMLTHIHCAIPFAIHMIYNKRFRHEFIRIINLNRIK